MAIYSAFAVFPISDLGLISLSQTGQSWLLRLSVQGFVTAGCSIAAIWGYVATKLYLHPETFSWKRALLNINRPVFLFQTLYLLPMVLGIATVWVYPPAISTDPSVHVTYVIDEITLPSAKIGPLLLAIGALVVFAFTVYPFLVLTRLRSQIKDKEVRSALKIITFSFSLIAVTILIAVAVPSFGYSILGLSNLLSVALLYVAVGAFRKPTFLKSFLGVVPSLESSPLVSHVDQVVLLYPTEIDKFAPISKYIIDAVSQENRVFYFHDGDETQLREDLLNHGVDVRQYMVSGLLTVVPLGSLYQKRGNLDDTAIQYCVRLAEETRKLGKTGLKLILDFDELIIGPIRKFIAHLTDNRWTSPDHFVHVLMAFHSTAFKRDEAVLAELRSKVRIMDVSESMNVFSKTVGLSHSEIAGKKILLEFDPQSNYDRILKTILAESASNFERTVIFTRKGSPIHSLVQRQPGAKIFELTSRVSYPKIESENRVLLPAYDTSLVLDALTRTIEAYIGSSFTIVFDDISHYMFTLGLDRAYSLVRQAIEVMVSNNITGIFTINSKAHEERALPIFEGLFDMEVICEPGTRIPEIRRRLSLIARN